MLLDKTRHTRAALTLAVAAWVVPHLPLLSQTAGTSQPANELAGQVVEDSTGTPVASAELRFHQQGLRELAADLETDRQGRFRTTDLLPGEYTIDLTKPNYVTTTFKLRVPATGVRLRLVRYGVIDGRATNAAGRPLHGRILASGGRTAGMSRVAVLVKTPDAGQLRSIREVPLEDDGHYRIFDLPPGQYVIGLWYSGLNEGSGMQLYPDNAEPRVFTVSGGEEYSNVTFTVIPRQSYAVSGRIELPEGKAFFQLALGLPEQPALPVAQTLTGDGGAFRFEHVPPGAYDLFVAGPAGGYGAFGAFLGRGDPLFGRTRIQVTAQDVEDVTVPLRPGRSVAVALRAPGSGKAPPGCPPSSPVSLVPLEPWAVMLTSNTQVGFGKEETVRNLAPGRFRLTATGLGAGCYQVNQPVVDLSGDVSGPVAVEVGAAGSVRGVLKIDAGQAAQFIVVLLDADNPGQVQAQIAFPGQEGQFEFQALRPGRYRIASRPIAEGRTRWIADVSRMLEIEVPGGAETRIELPAGWKGDRP